MTALSGRIGLASEPTARGASADDSVQCADVKLAKEIRSLGVWMIVALVALGARAALLKADTMCPVRPSP